MALLDRFEGEEAIEDENGDVEGLRQETELTVHVNDPFDKEGSAGVLDLARVLYLGQIVGIDLQLRLYQAHILVNLSGKLSTKLRVTQLELVRENHVLADLPPVIHQPLFEDIGDRRVVIYCLGCLGCARSRENQVIVTVSTL